MRHEMIRRNFGRDFVRPTGYDARLIPSLPLMRLNKHISDTGYCSRREADRLIGEGRVTVNGQRGRVGSEVGEGDTVQIDGQTLKARTAVKGQRRHVYIALNKPMGVTSTTEADVKDNIVDLVDHQQRIFPIGRLDKDSEGLILLTSNGDIVNAILRAENKLEKEYLVVVNRQVTDEFLRGMSRGVPIHGEITLPCKTGKLGHSGFRIVLVQGMNRQIRLMTAHFGLRVKQLLRVRIGNIKLGHLKPGKWRNLTDAELRGLLPGHDDW
jgi:23S rRNA pseudouridine2604 synthase